jgi:hypothetical protein
MDTVSDLEMRELLYRQLSRQPGVPVGARALMLQRAEALAVAGHSVDRDPLSPAWSFRFHGDVEGCKGAAYR